jgi:hypothetical protein
VSETRLSGSDRFFIGLAVVADVISVIGFLGIHPSSQIRWIVVAILTLLGAIASGVTLVTSVIQWYAPKGSLYPSGYHSKRIFTSLAALVISITLGAFLISQANPTLKKKPSPHSTNSSTHSTSLGNGCNGSLSCYRQSSS